ncbi:MAG: M48 family metallopeptidase [Betaproteobacteria bacterium]|uniref:Zn-dependent protease with chaperone function n=1 Tax=Serpentinimonas maccroryi TaxID=1458426 RepID=A0A060NM93_9BURK|nr:M48 family metallopeptidase [Serpentinimonas maccroryi]MCL5969112.1 M48 family metallopeptidase [Betaproteobacteria bacterium]BAO82500.1 Zn-dependent protease with chaperone function [Serpentinimonas maccroryi]
MDFLAAYAPLLWTAVFCLLLTAGLLTRLWLAGRQMRHVAQHRASVPAAFAERIGLAAHQKAADYTIAKTRLGLLEGSFGAALLIGWTLLGGLNALNLALLAWLGPGLLQQVALLAAFTALGALLELPLSWYRTFVLEQKHGFNRMTPRLWLSDGLKGALVGAAIGLPVVALLLWLMQAAGPLWWLWAWALWMAFNLLLLVLYPSLIAPLFNRFEPLQDPALKARIETLLARCGFKAQGLFVMDGSKRSAHANAYFTGFGPAKRVVFFDTLLQQLAPGEIDAVLAHELGHYKRRHILKRIVLMAVLSLGALALLGWLAQQVWFYTGLGVTPNLMQPNGALALILFLLVTPLVGFFASPWMSALSRRQEFEADAFAAAHADPRDLASALLKLYQDNASTLTPDPLYVRFYYSHPPASERLARLGA